MQGSEPLLLIRPCSVSISKAYIFREGSKNLKKMGDFFKSSGVHRVDKHFTPTYESKSLLRIKNPEVTNIQLGIWMW